MRYSFTRIVFPAQAGIQRSFSWIPAFAGMTDLASTHLRDTRLDHDAGGLGHDVDVFVTPAAEVSWGRTLEFFAANLKKAAAG